MKIAKVWCALLAVSVTFGLRADVLEVGPGKTYTDIATAIGAAKDHDTVLVYDGVYEPTAQIEVTKPITLKSANGAAVTEIRRTSNYDSKTDRTMNRCLYVNNKDARVEDLTISGGFLYWNNSGVAPVPAENELCGAGVLIDTAGGTLSGCVVTNNYISRHVPKGAGVAAFGADAVVTNCTIAYNRFAVNTYTIYGLGVYMKGGATVVDCDISHNSRERFKSSRVDGSNGSNGGGVYSDGGTLLRCRITDNYDQRGGGVYAGSGTTYIEGCLIAENKIVAYSGITNPEYTGAGVYAVGTVRMTNCTIVANEACSAAGLYNDSASSQFVNCLFADNRNYNVLPSKDTPYVTTQAAALFENCVTEGTVFAETTDYTLDPASASVDVGWRPLAVTAPVCGFSVAARSPQVVGKPVSFVGTVHGAGDASVRVSWKFGDGAWSDWAEELTASKAFDAVGTVSVSFKAEVGGVETDAVTKSVRIAPAKITVGETGADFTDIASALAAAENGTTVEVAADDYLLDDQLVVDKGVRLVAADGPAVTTLRRKVTTNNAKYQISRVMTVAHPDAWVEGFTITGGYTYHYYGLNFDYAGGGVKIEPAGGALVGCVIAENAAPQYNGRGMGVAAFGPDALVSNCVFDANKDFNYIYEPMCGYGVYAACGAKVTHSVFRNHKQVSNSYGAICLLTGSCASHCVVTNNSLKTGAGIYIASAGSTVDNCLVANNTASGNGGGIYAAAQADIVNCTLADNKAASGGGLYANAAGVRVVNCLFCDNSSTTAGTEQWGGNASVIYSNCFANVDFTSVSVGCVKGENVPNSAGFAKQSANPYGLSANSPCIDQGWDGALGHSVALDLAGTNRYSKAIDIGCYEFQYAEYSASMGFVAPLRVVGADYVFTVETKLSDETATLGYEWTIDGVTGERTSSKTWTGSFDRVGEHTVSVVVYVNDEEKAPLEQTFTVAPTDIYVVHPDTLPASVPPFMSEETAASNILDAVAVAAAGSTIHVGPGVYALTDTISLSEAIVVVGTEGAAKTEFRRTCNLNDRTDRFERCAYLDDPGARIEGVTLSGGFLYQDYNELYDCGGAGALIDAKGGTLSGCVITNCHAARYLIKGIGVLIASASGVVTNCVISDNANSTYGTPWTFRGGGVYVANGGVLTHSTVRGNAIGEYCNNVYGAGVFVTQGRVSHCRIVGNVIVGRGADGTAAGLELNPLGDVTVDNCLVVGNENASGCGGLRIQKPSASCGIVLLNCTVADNVGTACGGVSCEDSTTAVFRNCLVENNWTNDETASDWLGGKKASVTYTLCPSAALPSGEGNVGEPARLHGNYVPYRNSAACEKGSVVGYEGLLEPGTDVYGRPRVLRGKIDIGACQNQTGGLMLLVR